ncbi:TonB-dependent receptor [Lysobacter sp. 5GHs7-4]|uniref:TonB-dependent receptor domain-containing protein n=1 Tax=Lysobacter sp. 5GHs7-4 TaxID=2904253 RepID=UPI001E616D54|nr:TonB-dependent receptor [Lysobacter sp. 5GHs7-4]UHQ21617.1 TonB-dependent receptor [Lysobacter sp. 5GHs7-4]
MRRPRPGLLACALASCLALAAPAALAQSTAATIRGQVTVDSAPATDAKITATNVATGLSRSVQSGANGSYSVAGLPPGTYRIDVSAGGQTNSKTIAVQVGQTATLNLSTGGVAEAAPAPDATDIDAVTVTAAPVFETKTSEVATYVSSKQIEALPQASRNFLAFADIVPGVETRTGTDGSISLRSGAQLANGINVFIDGVGQKDYVLKGGISGQDSTRGNPFPQLGIAEYKVITSNYKAEYDQLSSAAVSAVTRSGTNEFSGSLFWDGTFTGWRAPTVIEDKSGNKIRSKEEQYGVAFGGPILQDRMHFFLTYEGKDYLTPKEVAPGRNFRIDQLPGFLQEAARNTTAAPFHEDLYFGKIDFAIDEANLLEFTAKHRKEEEVTAGSIGGVNAGAYGTSNAGEETRLDLRYQYSAADWLNDAHLTFEDVSFGPRPLTDAPGYNLRVPRADQVNLNNPVMETIFNTGGSANLQNKGQKGYALQNDFTFFGWQGHTIKAGFKYKLVDISAYQRQPANPQFRYDINRSLTQPYEVNFSSTGIGQTGPVETDNKQFGIYLQDDWEVNEHLTLNLGLRWDYETSPAYEDFVTPAAVVTALRNYPNINNARVDYDYNDFISTGNNRKAFKDAWQPRLGFSYDFAGDQRHVIFGGAGRSYNRNQFDFLARERYNLAFQSYTYFFNGPGHVCTTSTPDRCLTWDPKYLNQNELDALVAANPNRGTQVVLLDNNLKTPYSDQFSLGMRNSFGLFGHDWNSSVTVMHVLSHDGILFSVGNRRPDGTFFPPGRSFGNTTPANLPGFGQLLIGRNAVETRLTSLLLSLEKPYTQESGWGVSLAYTYSDAKENRNNSDTFSFDYPNLDDVAFTEALGIAKHRFVATGIVDLPWDMTFSAKLKLTSPIARESLNFMAIDVNNGYFDPYFPGEDIAFKQLDVGLQKVWDTGTDLKLRVRGDVLNVFNWRNWNNFDSGRGSGFNPANPNVPARPNPNFGRRNGDGIDQPTRTFKLTFGVDW